MAATSVIVEATNAVALVRSHEGFLQTEQFLGVCRLVLPVVDKLGTAFALVKGDIQGNITRLADKAATDPGRYARVFSIVQDEVIAGTAMGSSSCTKGLLWLKRAMEFMVAIIKAIVQKPDLTLAQKVTRKRLFELWLYERCSQVVSETYTATLMQFHGFLVSSAFTLAFKFVPSREYFIDNIGAGSADTTKRMEEFVALFEPILQEVHTFLVENGLNDPTKV